MNINEAFKQMLIKKWHYLPENKRYMWKYRFKKNNLSLQKKEEILYTVGYIKDEVWSNPTVVV